MPKVNIKNTFSKALDASNKEKKIQELQEQIDELRSKQAPNLEKEIEALREQLLQRSGEVNIDLALIRPNPEQPRQTITQESIESIARSLESEGQDTPVILIPDEDLYLLWDGERRWRGAKLLGWKSLKAVLAPMPENLHRKALITFLQHEDLNALDRAEAVVNEIHLVTDHPHALIPSAIRSMVRRIERNKESLQVKELINLSKEEQLSGIEELNLSDEQGDILGVIIDLQINPASFAANDLQILSLFDDLKQAIRESGLKGSHAQALQKLNAENLNVGEKKSKNIRIKVCKEVLESGLSLARTRALVKELLAKHNSERNDLKYEKQMKSMINSFDKIEFDELAVEQIEQLKEFLADKLNELEDRLL